MAYIVVFLLGVLLSVSPSTQLTQEDIKLLSTHEFTHVGEDVLFRCEVNNLDPSKSTIFFGKEVWDTNIMDLVSQMISAAGVVQGIYTKRFSIEQTQQQALTIFTMTLKSAQKEDSGTYMCGEVGLEAKASIHVYRLPEIIEITQASLALVDNTLMFERNTPQKISCHFDKVYPLPEITVSTPLNNYSSGFSRVEQLELPCSKTGLGADCILEFYYNVTVYADDFLPSGIEHGQNLVCSARFPDSGMAAKTISATIDVKFDPIIECEPIQPLIMHVSGEISCIVHANPMVDGFYWQIPMGDDSSKDLHIDETLKEYHATQQDVNSGRTQVRVKLMIGEVVDYHKQEYILVVPNGTEPITSIVMVTEEAGSAISVSPDVNMMWTAMVTVFAAATALLVYHIK